MFSSWSDYDFFSESYHKDNGFTLPWHNIETKELKPQLQLLLSHFDIDYNLKNLNIHWWDWTSSMVVEIYFPMVKKRKKKSFLKVFKGIEESSIYY